MACHIDHIVGSGSIDFRGFPSKDQEIVGFQGWQVKYVSLRHEKQFVPAFVYNVLELARVLYTCYNRRMSFREVELEGDNSVIIAT